MTNRQPSTPAWWRLLLAAITALVVGVLGAGTASATMLPELGNGVGASTPVVVNIVGVHVSVSAGQRWGHVPPQAGTVVATGVAAKTVTNIGGHSLDDLSRSASVIDRNGLSGAGRALQKHGDRPGSVFSRSTGTAAERNAQGQTVVDDILTDPQGASEVLDNVMNVWDSSGRGVRFNTDGSFMGLLEPR